jgi:conjugal transfer pilus assembly protein TraW
MNKLIILLLSYIAFSYAEDLGSIGKTYTIGEQSLLEYVKKKATKSMEDGSWKKYQQMAIDKTEQKIDHPPIIMGVTPVLESSVRYYDPSIKINKDIVDPYTKTILAHKGQIINPSNYMRFNNELIFVDGRDNEQIKFALSESKKSKFKCSIILIATNNFRDLLKSEHYLFFYDQGAVLVKKFGITHVPSLIYQDDIRPNELRIEEVKL